MKTVNPTAAKHHVIDGINFLKGFYKLSRLQYLVLLGKLNPEHIHINVLYPDEPVSSIVAAGIAPKSTSSHKKSHWSADQLEKESARDHYIHVKEHPKPMLPSLLEGVNPWYDWGLAESGFLSILSTRPVSAFSKSNARSRKGEETDGSPTRSRSPSRSPPKSPSGSPALSPIPSRSNSPALQQPSFHLFTHSFQPADRPQSAHDTTRSISSAINSGGHRPKTAGSKRSVATAFSPGSSLASLRPNSAPSYLQSITIDSPAWRTLHVGGTHAGVNEAELLVTEAMSHGDMSNTAATHFIESQANSLLGHSLDREATTTHALQTLQHAEKVYGKKVTRTSLPSTFTAVGLARQMEKRKLFSTVTNY